MSLQYMPLYIGDYLADTGHLTTVEHGAYMLLLMHYWRNGSLPDNPRQLATITRLSLREWNGIEETMRSFFTSEWKHKRVEVELKKAKERYSRRAAAGRAGGIEKSRKSDGPAPSKALALLEQCLSNHNYKKERTSQEVGSYTTSQELSGVAPAAPAAPPVAPETPPANPQAGPDPRHEPKEPAGAKARRATRIPDDWKPSELDRQFAKSRGLSQADLEDEIGKFRDYWAAKGGADAAKLDWSATWRNWVRNWRGPAQAASAQAKIQW